LAAFPAADVTAEESTAGRLRQSRRRTAAAVEAENGAAAVEAEERRDGEQILRRSRRRTRERSLERVGGTAAAVEVLDGAEGEMRGID
jgi:hypothetical protein